MIFISYHPCYKLELPLGHRFPMDKYPMLRDQLIYEGSFSNENFFKPKKINNKIKITAISFCKSKVFSRRISHMDSNCKLSVRKIKLKKSYSVKSKSLS